MNMKLFGYYWKGWRHAWSDLLYYSVGLWTTDRVMDEITDAIHPDFGWATMDAFKHTEDMVNEAFARGYEAGKADKEIAGVVVDDAEETLA